MERSFLERLRSGEILVCDGAMGTQLQARGLGVGEYPDSWNLTHPWVVTSIHRAYLDEGCDLIITNTFGANGLKLKRFGKEAEVYKINLAGARIAKEAAKERGMVLGDIGPTGEFVAPAGSLKAEDLYEVFKGQVLALVEGGVDAIIVETMSDLVEAKAAVRAAKENSSLPVIASMTFQKGRYGYRTMMGLGPQEATKELEAAGCDVIGSNCGAGIREMIDIIREIRPLTDIPLIAEPNAGLPKLVKGKTVFDETHQDFARNLPDLMSAGANIIGGCCGTTPQHIAEIVKLVRR